MTATNRAIRRVLGIVCCLFIQGLAGVEAAAAAITAQRVAGDVYYFRGESGQASPGNRGFTSNAGFVVTSEGVLVVDALGTPALAREMLAAIARVTSKPVRRVIVTHYHADHVYGLQVFKAAGAEIWARREGQVYLRSDLARERLAERRESLAPWVDARTRLLPADRWLELGEDRPLAFTLGKTRFQLISGGAAHAPDDLMLFVEDAGVLFAGDLFFSGRLPFVVDGNTRGWLGALERMKALEPTWVVPGHGAVSHDVVRDLATTEDYLRFLRARMTEAVEAMESFDEAYASTDWSRFAQLPTFQAANRRNAYSVYLEMQGELLGADGSMQR